MAGSGAVSGARKVSAAADGGGNDDGAVAAALQVAERNQQWQDRPGRPAADDHPALHPPQLALVAVAVPEQRAQLLGEAPVEPAPDTGGG